MRGPSARFVVDGPFSEPVYDYPEPQDPLRYAKRAVPDCVKAVEGNIHKKALEDEPGKVNESMEAGWFMKMEVGADAADGLMDQTAYDAYLKTLDH